MEQIEEVSKKYITIVDDIPREKILGLIHHTGKSFLDDIASDYIL